MWKTRSANAQARCGIAFNNATASVRATFDETVEQARARHAAAGTADTEGEQSFIDDLRRRLDDLITRAGDALNKEEQAPTAPSTNGDGEVPHMIDGEVVSTEDVPPPNTKDN